jgi:hypothetical protein
VDGEEDAAMAEKSQPAETDKAAEEAKEGAKEKLVLLPPPVDNSQVHILCVSAPTYTRRRTITHACIDTESANGRRRIRQVQERFGFVASP